jgi:hypothetical protein
MQRRLLLNMPPSQVSVQLSNSTHSLQLPSVETFRITQS